MKGRLDLERLRGGGVWGIGWGAPDEQGHRGWRESPPLSWPPSLAVCVRLLGYGQGDFALCSLSSTCPHDGDSKWH